MSKSESAVQNDIRLDAAYRNVLLHRNNVGVLLNENGRPVRYGLANDSKNLNENIKSSDLIGITPVFITPDMVGTILGVYTAIECKPDGWKFNIFDKHCLAQSNFHDIVTRHGGKAGFATGVLEARRIMGHL